LSKPENPPAFPLATTVDTTDFHGMDLRDHFAGVALPTTIELVLECSPHPDNYQGPTPPMFHEAVARLAYQMADAMLAERLIAR
jgi:hypothetical protein